MSYFEQLKQEIADKCEAMSRAGSPLHPAWITHAICNDHAEGLSAESEHADFWRHGGHRTVRSEVGQYLRKEFGPDAESKSRSQPAFPGFDYIQSHYIVEREGDELAIPTTELTDEEIDATIARMRSTAATLYAHADELERFKSLRVGTVVPDLLSEPAEQLA
jgi:hypothetical protein